MILERLDTVISFALVMLLLSLLITTLVQMAGLVLALRGKNLLWGLKRLLGQVDPQLGQFAYEIADKALRHPAVSHMGRLRAVALRKEELIRILTDLVRNDRLPEIEPWLWRRFRSLPAGLQNVLRKAKRLKTFLIWLFPNPARPLSPEAKGHLQSVVSALVPGASDEETARVQAVAASLSDLLPSQAAAVKTVVDQMLEETNQLSSEINAWFDTVMDRTSERFKLLNRWITAAAAFLFVFFLQVDSVDILRQLSNKEVRAEVLKLYEPVLGLYGDVTKLGVEKENLASDVLASLQARPEVQAQLTPGAPDRGLDQWNEGEAWLKQHFKADLTESQKDQLVELYRTEFDKSHEALFGKVKTSGQKSQELIGNTGLVIFPDEPEYNPFRWNLQKVAGILMTGFLLSLGAPFWFNTLRKIADLRPIVARRVEGEAPKALR